jgi:hypothetical protein
MPLTDYSYRIHEKRAHLVDEPPGSDLPPTTALQRHHLDGGQLHTVPASLLLAGPSLSPWPGPCPLAPWKSRKIMWDANATGILVPIPYLDSGPKSRLQLDAGPWKPPSTRHPPAMSELSRAILSTPGPLEATTFDCPLSTQCSLH